MEPKSIVIPSQYFEFVPLPVTENEPLIRKRIELESHADKGGKTIEEFRAVISNAVPFQPEGKPNVFSLLEDAVEVV